LDGGFGGGSKLKGKIRKEGGGLPLEVGHGLRVFQWIGWWA